MRVKIAKLKKDLEKVAQNREIQRKRRSKIPLKTCALVGYTNAGKSSILNALTDADVLVENKLFATLDPITRRLKVPGLDDFLLTDTVGFISNLPHSLIDAFKSTLEEAALADLLIVVVDASDSNAIKQYETVNAVLDEIGAGKKNRILVLNKIDMVENPNPNILEMPQTVNALLNDSENNSSEINITVPSLVFLEAAFPNAIKVSVKEKINLGELKKSIVANLSPI